ncbi:MAG: hypothetical protein K6E50_14915 [Lachnospiraceae bacterium]|nr:hypothetical protein [Lachnospiraceae bacterium]
MASIEEVLDDLIQKEPGEIASIAVQMLGELQDKFAEIDPEDNGLGIIIALLSTSAGMDDVLTPTESALVSGILEALDVEMTDDEITDLIRETNTSDSYELVGNVYRLLSSDEQTSFITFYACMFAIDKEYSDEELEMLKTLFEQAD